MNFLFIYVAVCVFGAENDMIANNEILRVHFDLLVIGHPGFRPRGNITRLDTTKQHILMNINTVFFRCLRDL